MAYVQLKCTDESCAVVFEVIFCSAGSHKNFGSAIDALLDCPVCPVCGADAEEVEE